MNVARLNFSHGDFAAHKKVIDNLRSASRSTGIRMAIMADLSGPKMRIGKLIELKVKEYDEAHVKSMCDKLLANPVIENYRFEVVK